MISRQSTTRLKDALHDDECPDQLALAGATHALLRVLWSGRWRSISPRYFVNAVWKHSTLFAARKQQDANEFLNFYLGRVDDELKPRTAKTSVMVGNSEAFNWRYLLYFRLLISLKFSSVDGSIWNQSILRSSL